MAPGLEALGPGREFDRIRSILARMPGGPDARVRVGPGDDCAVLANGTVISTDLTVEDVHFRRAWMTLEEIGYRAATAALSDLGAVAAEPVGLLVSIGVGIREPADTTERLGAGVIEACAAVGAAYLGGDLSASDGGLILDVVAVGTVALPVLRGGARPGDEVWVTGVLGGSGGAVRIWEAGGTPPPELREAFVRPVARVDEARWLEGTAGLHALIDLSDGVARDAGHVAAASGVSVVLDRFLLPAHPALSARFGKDEVLELALGGGEDYELLAVAPPGRLANLAGPFADRFGVTLTRIGTVGEGSGVYVRAEPGGTPEPAAASAGFDHFSDGGAGS